MSFATINSFRGVTGKLGLCLWHLNSLTAPRKWTPSYVRVTVYKCLQSSNINKFIIKFIVNCYRQIMVVNQNMLLWWSCQL